ncbi:MAG: DUF1572 family protein [Acidobacteriota bacterium]|nr:DUF1572 family protein [Acidobacteriota bacterium]
MRRSARSTKGPPTSSSRPSRSSSWGRHVPSSPLAAAVLEDLRRSFRTYKALGDRAIAQVADADLARTPDAESNSIAIIVKHLAGNMRSRFTEFLTSDGEKPDRHRDREFEPDDAVTRAALLASWEAGWRTTFEAVEALDPEDLLRTVTIRQEPMTVLQALNRQAAHYAYHVGQLVYLAKALAGRGWQSLSIPRGQSARYSQGTYLKGNGSGSSQKA